MRKPFDGDYRISQTFGANPAMYAKFGYKGHNGMDWAMPNGTRILAPHSGKIIEARNDANGYGNYVKIENSKEGSVLGHLQSFSVKVGQEVKEGELIGLSNNTGYSTGPHLHWGYYLFPRDRNNGYGGFIDQSKLYSEGNMYGGLDLSNTETMKVCVDVYNKLMAGELVEKEDLTKLQKQIADLKKNQEDLSKSVEDLKLLIKGKDKTLAIITKERDVLMAEKETLLAQLDYYKPYKSRYETALVTQVEKYSPYQLISMGVKKMLRILSDKFKV
jgi:septal ring factor EnvC (AmiA/AmiB activator)